jgi:glycine/D-amino acid oxidase-like deaminating enzyme
MACDDVFLILNTLDPLTSQLTPDLIRRERTDAQPRNMNIIIVGAGVFGLSAALELHERGCNVTIYDKSTIPVCDSASTDINKAVRIDYDDEFYLKLAKKSIEKFRVWNLEEENYHECGVLLLGTHNVQDLEQQPFEAKSIQLLKEADMWSHCEVMSAENVQDKFPAWQGMEFNSAYFNKFGGYVNSGKVVQYMAKMCRKYGIGILENCAFVDFVQEGNEVKGIKTVNGDCHSADLVIMACGAWTASLVPGVETQAMATGQTVLHFTTTNPDKYHKNAFQCFLQTLAEQDSMDSQLLTVWSSLPSTGREF